MELILEYRGLELHVDEMERPYFEAAAANRLIMQQCEACSIVRYPPSKRCVACGSEEWNWRETSGHGRASSCVVVEHSVRPTFPAPYMIGLVELDDLAQADSPENRVRILSTILAADGATNLTDLVPDGTLVEVCFRPLADGFALPEFKVKT